ncbi:MAG: hypothetical protein NVS3B16_05520 [Vulcanimicrobiaceae bacterium]
MDRSDLAYLRTIRETLPADAAADTLATMAAFRNEVRRIRQQTREQIAQLYQRYGRTYGWLDPIDPYAPPATGLTHADETRIATISDGARASVEELRAGVNRNVTERMAAAHIDILIAAKRRRRAAFEAALEVALETQRKALGELTELADGWY